MIADGSIPGECTCHRSFSALIETIVANCGDDYDAGVNQLADCATDRIVNVRIDGWSAETHVHDANVVGIAICEHPIKRGQH